MKKLAIIMTLLLFGTQVIAAQTTNATYNKKPAQQTQTTQVKQTKPSAQQKTDDSYLLKYNIDDLEAAPWLNGGKRIYNK